MPELTARRLRAHPGILLGVMALLAAAIAGVLVLSGGNAKGSTAASDYAVLSSSASSGGLAAVSSSAEAAAATGPIVNAQDSTIDVASAKEVSVGVPGMRVWVAKSNEGGICILALKPQPARSGPVGPASGCTPEAKLGKGASIEQFGPSGQNYETGAVPDGVSSVTVELTNGSTQTVAVHDNAYAVETTTPISQVSFTNEGTTQTVEVGGTQ